MCVCWGGSGVGLWTCVGLEFGGDGSSDVLPELDRVGRDARCTVAVVC